MKKSMSRLAVTSVIALAASSAQADVNLENSQEKLSYSVGVLLGAQLANDFNDLDMEAFVEGFNHQYGGDKTLLDSEQAMATIQSYQQQKMSAAGAEALTESEAFLAEKGSLDNVITTDSGLMYKVISQGDGAQPKATDKVTVHYRGTLMNGQEFDSSYSRGEPTSFPLNGVIAGWTEGLQLMKVGAVYEFYIHPSLAYGERGAGGSIGPNQALVFQVELISIGE